MASIFISYKGIDAHVVDLIAPLLVEKGHTVRFDQDLYIGAGWQTQLMEFLLSSDIVLLLWSKNTSGSQFICAEVGAARASDRIGLLPVMIEGAEIPNFLRDLICAQLYTLETEALEKLVDDLDKSIQKFIAYREQRKPGSPKIFISHRHKDEKVVRALLICLETYFKIDKQDIRCTSVNPYRLPVGENTSERLRQEISEAEVVLGILTTDTLTSAYVAFELGSAWGQRVWTCPLLACGADQRHIPDPIRDLSPLFLSDPDDCSQLLSDLKGFTSLIKRQPTSRELKENINQLSRAVKYLIK